VVEGSGHPSRFQATGLGPGLSVDGQLQWVRIRITDFPVDHERIEGRVVAGKDRVDPPAQHQRFPAEQERNLDSEWRQVREPAGFEGPFETFQPGFLRASPELEFVETGADGEPRHHPFVEPLPQPRAAFRFPRHPARQALGETHRVLPQFHERGGRQAGGQGQVPIRPPGQLLGQESGVPVPRRDPLLFRRRGDARPPDPAGLVPPECDHLPRLTDQGRGVGRGGRPVRDGNGPGRGPGSRGPGIFLRGRWHGGSLVECRRILEIAGTAACPFQPGRPGVGRDDEQSFRPGGGDIGQPVLGEPVLLLQLLPVGVDAPFGVVGELGDRIRVSPERRGQQTRIRAPVSCPVGPGKHPLRQRRQVDRVPFQPLGPVDGEQFHRIGCGRCGAFQRVPVFLLGIQPCQ